MAGHLFLFFFVAFCCMFYKIIMVIKKIDKLIYQKYFFSETRVCGFFRQKKTTQIVEIELLQMKFEIDHTKLSTI